MGNDNTGKTVARNTSVLMVSQVVTWTLSLAYTFFLARYFGPADVGQYYLATSIWMILNILIFYGTDVYVMKEVARHPEKTGELFGTVVVLRLMLLVLSTAGVLVYADFMEYPSLTMSLIGVLAISQIFHQLGYTCRAFIQGLERMEYISIADILIKLIIIGFGIGLMFAGFGLVAIVTVSILGEFVYFVYLFRILRSLQKLTYRPSLALIKIILVSSWSYMAFDLTVTLYLQVDYIIIDRLVDQEQLGWYGAADRLISTLLFVPTVFLQAVFPMLARMYSEKDERLGSFVSKTFNALFLAAIPLAFGLIVLGHQIVNLLYGEEFMGAVPIVMVMTTVLVLLHLNILIGKFLISSDRQNVWTVIMVVATIATVPLDLLFIPWAQARFENGAIGGGLAYIVTELTMLVFGILLLPKGYLTWDNVIAPIKIVASGLLMTVSIWWLRDAFMLFPIALGAIVYIVSILVLRVLPPEDLRLVQDYLLRGWQKIKGRTRLARV